MNIGTHLKVEATIPVGEWIFEIWLVNNRGWCGPGNHYDVNELEIAKYPVWLYSNKVKENFTAKEIEELRKSTGPRFFNIERVEKGEVDNLEDIELYKAAIKRFRNLAAFL